MKLLIAEDEMTTREGLVQCIPSYYTDVRVAANGQAAYELALDMKPDVVLCDIRMPKLNGIELAKLLRKQFPNIHILFISGYADKEYLKAAIALQADGYLEKPIDEAELIDHLTRAAEQVRARCKSESDQERMAEYANLFARRQLLHTLLRGSAAPEEALAKYPALSQELMRAGRLAAACICLSWADTMSAQLIDTTERRIIEAIETHLAPNVLCGALTNTRIGIVVYGDATSSALMHKLENVLNEAAHSASHPLCACACIASPNTSPHDLPSQYFSCLNQAQWMVFAVGHGVAVSSLTTHAPHLPEDLSQELSNHLSSHDFDGAKALILRQTQEIAQLPSGSIDSVRKYYEMLLSVCLNAENVVQPNMTTTIQRLSVFSAFARLHTLDELARFILVHIDNLLPSIDLPETSCAKVDEAMEYVRRNLSDPSLSVQSIAAQLGLTENYLSTLFRRETGTTLHKVIIELRLERAKYLLRKKYRLSDVAQKTGFSSANYFHSVFKKHTGYSPADYARSQQKADPQEEKA